MTELRRRRICVVMLLLAVTGCAQKAPSALRWPWSKAPVETASTGPTPKERIKELHALAKRAPEMPPEEQEKQALQLSEQLAAEQDSIIRCEILRTMAYLRTPTAAAMLRAGLEDKDLDVKTAVCDAWGERGDDEAIQILGDTLTQDPNLDVRLAAARGLAKIKKPAAMQPLGLALDDPDPALQRRAVESLREVSGRDFGNDVVAWRTFVQGGEPPHKPFSVADLFRRWF